MWLFSMAVDKLKSIAQSGRRIFDREDLVDLANNLGLSQSYIPRMLSLMVQKGSLISLGKGLYTLPMELLAGGPIHSFEIAIKLAKIGAISHRSAMSHYNLTDQVISTIYVTVPQKKGANLSTIKEYFIGGTKYQLIRVLPQHYWGIKPTFIGEARIWITDLEKTLIDGLINPQYCGGMREVIYAFEQGIGKVSANKLYEYAKKTTTVVCKRLGWILDQINEYPEIQEQLASIPMSYYQKLDPQGKRLGKHHSRWMLMENF